MHGWAKEWSNPIWRDQIYKRNHLSKSVLILSWALSFTSLTLAACRPGTMTRRGWESIKGIENYEQTWCSTITDTMNCHNAPRGSNISDRKWRTGFLWTAPSCKYGMHFALWGSYYPCCLILQWTESVSHMHNSLEMYEYVTSRESLTYYPDMNWFICPAHIDVWIVFIPQSCSVSMSANAVSVHINNYTRITRGASADNWLSAKGKYYIDTLLWPPD